MRLFRIVILFSVILSYEIYGQHFTDITTTLGIDQAAMSDTHGSGISLCDFDNDGDYDFYLCTARNSPDVLYENHDGNFLNASHRFESMLSQRSRASLWFDYNADGLMDLAVAGDCDFDEQDCPETKNLHFYLNSNGTFINVTDSVGLTGFGPSRSDQTLGGLSAGDLNLDGYMDFIVTIRNGRLLAFINEDGERFVESAFLLGIDTLDEKYYQPIIADLNRDNFPDIYCNVDFGPNILYLNDGRMFIDRSIRTRSNNSFNEMGMAYADFDRDDDLDLYATNIENFLGDDVHNILLRNELQSGNFFFEESGKQLNAQSGGWGWGATFIDANNDGWEDLATTNGWDLPFEVIDQSKIWENEQGSHFIDQSMNWGFDDSLNAATLLSVDFDNDGDLDLMQSIKQFTPGQPIRILENNLDRTDSTNFIKFELSMGGRNKFAIGASLTAYYGNENQTKYVVSGSSFYGQEPNQLFFGLGKANSLDSVRISWPGGTKSSSYSFEANQHYHLDDSDFLHTPLIVDFTSEERSIIIEWKDQNFSHTTYEIQRSESPLFVNFKTFKSLPEEKIFSDVTALPNEFYYYRIRAVNEAEEISSSFSDVIEVQSVVVGLNDSERVVKVKPTILNTGVNLVTIQGNDWLSRSDIYLTDLLGKPVGFNLTRLNDNEASMEMLIEHSGVYLLVIGDQVTKLFVI